MDALGRGAILVDFYFLERSPLERVLPSIGEKVLLGGEKLLVVAADASLSELDTQLWSYARDAFLPHGRCGRPGADKQPILLSDSVEPANGASNLALADGVWREEALSFSRVFFFFDSGRLDAAREAWRALKDRDGVERRYWKQDERGKWVQGP